jgi:hypothetical protein
LIGVVAGAAAYASGPNARRHARLTRRLRGDAEGLHESSTSSSSR